MERYADKVALVTGASSGIGAAICKELVRNGMTVIGVARRVELVEHIAKGLESLTSKLVAYKCDMTKDKEVYALFEYIRENYKGLHICINNAGKVSDNSLLGGNPNEWRQLMDLNVIAYCLCTKLSIESMRNQGVDGHIINIGSMSSHLVHNYGIIHIYAASKHAMKAITEGFRQELKEQKSGIKITAISPGLVETDMFKNHTETMPDLPLAGSMNPEDIAAIVVQTLSLPARVEINDILVTPTWEMKSNT